nr:unnamed protein product [Callosobruchus analis]
MGNSVDKLNEMLLDHPECGVICVCVCVCYSRKEGKYGGAAVYSRTFLDCRALPEVCEVSVERVIECAGIECFLKNERFVIVSLYRPPAGDIDLFLTSLNI